MSCETSTTIIPNPGRIKANKLSAKFQSFGKIGVFQTANFHKSFDQPSKHAPCRGFVHLLRPSSTLFDDDIVRKVVSESCDMFLSLQAIKKEANETGQDIQLYLKTACATYRSIARSCVQELQEEASLETTSKERQELCLNNSTVFYSIELIFHLSEIVCIDMAPGTILLPKLMDWMTYHFPISSQIQEINENRKQNPDSPIECHPEFWNSVKGLVLRGRCTEACELLGFHSKIRSSPAITTLRKLLNAMPYIVDVGGTTTVVDFTVRWSTWQKEAKSHIETGTFSHHPDLLQIAEVLAASDKSLAVIHEFSETWYQFLVSYLFYWEPTVQIFQLGDHANKCKRWFGTVDDRSLDRILMALFESDMLQVIKELGEFSESNWAAVHLTDLLYHAGRLASLDNHDHNVSEGLREDLLLEYGSLLVTHHSLWHLGLKYLDYCTSQGRDQLKLILPTLAYGSDTRVFRVIHEAKQRNMRRVAQEISSVRGRQALRGKRLGTALTWALRAKDVSLCTNVAEEILRSYSADGNFRFTDLLDHLGTAMLVSERLSFVGKYRQFQLNMKNNRRIEASRVLMDLSTSGFAPAFFLPILLRDTLHLIRDNACIFSSDDIYRLMASLEELKSTMDTLSPRDLEDTKATLGDSETEIRLTFAKCLAAAELRELSVK